MSRRPSFALPIAAAFVAVAALPGAARAAGPFEGTLEMKVTAKMGGGHVMVYISKAGMRSEIDMQAHDTPMKMVMLMKSSNKDVAYNIDEKTKTYGELDLAKSRERAKGMAPHKYTAKKLGKEKVAGYDCVHALVTDDKGGESEVWTNKDIVDYDSMARLMGPNVAADESLMKSLKEVGAEGFMVKMVHRQKGSEENGMTMELVKAEKKSLPASLFEIPAGYTKREGPAGVGGMGNLPPEIQEKLRERMKNMTPEQIEAMKKAMQGQH